MEERWVTINGHHVLIKDGEAQFARKQTESKQIDIHTDTKPMTFEEKENRLMEAYKKTGINFVVKGMNNIPGDTLDMVCSTVEDHLAKYDKEGFILDEVRIDADKFNENEKETVYASMSNTGLLSLNPHFFSKTKAELNASFQEDVESSWHPKGDASSIIIHELGHAKLNMNLLNMTNKNDGDIADWRQLYNYCHEANKLTLPSERITNSSAKYLFEKMQTLEHDCNTDKNILKEWGASHELHYSLYFWANPEHSYRWGVSKYGSTSVHEMVAEAYADVVVNGKDASFVSKKVYKEFIEKESNK